MANETYEKYLERIIYNAIQGRIQEVKNEIVNEAVMKFNKEMKEIVAKTSLKIMDFYSVERMGNEILIHVKIENLQSSASADNRKGIA